MIETLLGSNKIVGLLTAASADGKQFGISTNDSPSPDVAPVTLDVTYSVPKPAIPGPLALVAAVGLRKRRKAA